MKVIKMRMTRDFACADRKIGHVDPETGFVTMKGDKGKGKGKGRMKVRKDKDGNIIVTEETAEERARRKVRLSSPIPPGLSAVSYTHLTLPTKLSV